MIIIDNYLSNIFRHLEESLELMQSEFESMEDYWQKKIDEERIFYEEQMKVSENQFKELEVTIKEYDELLSNVETSKPHDSDGLFTIEENRNLEEKVNEWEDEISELKLQIEEMEKGHEEQILVLSEKVEGKLKSNLQTKNLDGLDLNDNKCKNSLSQKRRNLESSWIRVVEADIGQKTSLPLQQSSFAPHLSFSPRLGPLSLPSNTLINDQDEVKRLHDLRRYIQEDCNQLLLLKERLKNEVVSSSEAEQNNISLTCLSYSGGKVKQCDYAGSEDNSYDTYCDVGTQAPHVADGSCGSVDSFSTAFKVGFKLILCCHSSLIKFLGHPVRHLHP